MPDSIQGAGHGELHRSDSSLPEPAPWGQGTCSGENKRGTWREGLGSVGVYPNLGLRQNLSEEGYLELRQGKKAPPSFTEGTAGTEGPRQAWPGHRPSQRGQPAQRARGRDDLRLSKHPQAIDGANHRYQQVLWENSFKSPLFSEPLLHGLPWGWWYVS